MKKCGIYIIKNKINSKVYIGQSVNIENRWWQHKYSALNQRQDSYTEIHKAMAKYGVDNFFYEILEECGIEKLNEKEQYYIQYYNSYHNGYNMTLGGDSNRYEINGRAILTLEQVQEIRLMYGSKIRFKDAYKRYENVISKRGFQKVWHYETWLGVFPEVYNDENRKWHAAQAKGCINNNKNVGQNNTKRACSDEEIQNFRKLRDEGLSYEQISKQTGRATSVIRKYCLHREAKNPQACGVRLPHSKKVKNIETGLVFESLRQAAIWAGVKDKGKRISEIIKGNNLTFTSGHVPSTGERCHWEKY